MMILDESKFESVKRNKKLYEYRDIQGYEDELDQARSASDVARIPDWVFSELGLSKEECMEEADRRSKARAYASASQKAANELKNVSYAPIIPSDSSAASYCMNAYRKHKNTMVLELFHKGFDEELQNANLLGMFSPDGKLKARNSYATIKQYKQNNPKSKLGSALTALWVAQFGDGKLLMTMQDYDNMKQRVAKEKLRDEVESLIRHDQDVFKKVLNDGGYDVKLYIDLVKGEEIHVKSVHDTYDWIWDIFNKDIGIIYDDTTTAEDIFNAIKANI